MGTFIASTLFVLAVILILAYLFFGDRIDFDDD